MITDTHALMVQLPMNQVLNVYLTEPAAVRVWTEVAVAKAQAQAEQEMLTRIYHTGEKPTPGKAYDDRLTERTGRSLNTLYRYLQLSEKQGGLRGQKDGKWWVTEQAIREWNGDSKKRK